VARFPKDQHPTKLQEEIVRILFFTLLILAFLLAGNATPTPGTDILRGRIEITSPTVLLGELFLAKAVSTSDPKVDLLELDEANSPRALLNRKTGDFIFLNVEPGKYGLIVWEPMNSAPVNDPSTGETLFIELPPNHIVDVGILYFP